MSFLHIPNSSNSSAGSRDENEDLATHVLLCTQRFQSIIDRVSRIETAIDDIVKQSKENKKLLMGAFITVLTGTATSVITVLIKFSH